MLSRRGAGKPREIDLEGCPLDRDIYKLTMPQGKEFDMAILKVREILEKSYLSGTKNLGMNSNFHRSVTANYSEIH